MQQIQQIILEILPQITPKIIPKITHRLVEDESLVSRERIAAN